MKKKDSVEEEEEEEEEEDEEEEEEGGKKPSVNVNIELIFMMMDVVKDVHHEISLKAYVRDNIRVSFFSIQNLVFDPREHFLVPKHTIVPKEKHAEIIEKWNLSSKSQMPVIRYHVDPIVRIIGGVLEDIIEITRPSPSAGTYTYYRIVKP
jgi:DNA-directed RNA polymerase subunit H